MNSVMTPARVMTQNGHDPHFWIGSWSERVMTQIGHDPIQNLGHDRDPVMTHNTSKTVLK